MNFLSSLKKSSFYLGNLEMYSVLLLPLLSCVPIWLGEQHRDLHMPHSPYPSPSMLWGQGLGEQGKISEWCRKLARAHEAQPTPGHLRESSSTSSFQLYFFLFFITRWASQAPGIGQRGHGRTKESCFCTGERVLLKARFVTPNSRLSTSQGTDSMSSRCRKPAMVPLPRTVCGLKQAPRGYCSAYTPPFTYSLKGILALLFLLCLCWNAGSL